MPDSKTITCPTTVEITRRRDLETTLDQAVSQAIEQALVSPGKGILVTRQSHATFTIELTEDVAPGLIVEKTSP